MNRLISSTRFDTGLGHLVRRMRRHYNDHCITILTYHSISAEESLFTAGTSLRHHPSEFERQIEYLAENYNIIRLHDLITMLERHEQPRRAVVLTFDDGYADSIRQAMPILYRRRIPMTIFPITSVIGNADLMWQHKLAWLEAQGQSTRVFDALIAEGWERGDAHEPLGDFVRRNYRTELTHVLDSVFHSIGHSSAAIASKIRLYLEPEEIAEADPDFIEFGNHTDTHPVLSALTLTQQQSEITAAQRKLTDLTGRTPLAFSYPFGLNRHYTTESCRLVRSTGHRAALDMRRRMNVGLVDPFELSRRPAIIGPQSEFEKMIESWPANARQSPPAGGA